tara:strand:- start:1052 stop:2254 length:1203 start_codon:yes stop_codon:yes gene_type:complete
LLSFLIKDSYFISIALNHLAVDLLNSQRSMLLVYLAPSLGIQNAGIGLISLIYAMVASLSQPIFGWIADRYNLPWLSGISLVWMIVWLSFSALGLGNYVIVTLIVAALGSAAFHASGTEKATSRSQMILLGKVATGASLFFLFGQAGLAFGPALGGVLIERYGSEGILFLTFCSLPIAVFCIYKLHINKVAFIEVQQTSSIKNENMAIEYGNKVLFIGIFALLVMFRTAPQVASMTFIPKLFFDRGYSPGAYGVVTTVFMGGTALGGLVGGYFSDIMGRWKVIWWSLLASVLPMYYYPIMDGTMLYVLVFLSGFFNGGSHAVIVVIAQSLLPGRRALASGLIMGFMFASGALGSYAIGIAADYYSLVSAMQVNGLLCLLGSLIALNFWIKSKNLAQRGLM